MISIKASDLLPTFLLKHCTNLKHILQIHGILITTGLHHHTLLLARFIHTCSSLGLSDHAYSLFTKTSSHPNNTYLYNTMIRALSNNHHSATQAIFLYNKMRAVPLPPDTYSFPFLLKSVTQLSVGKQIHCQTLSTGFDSNVHVATAIILMYSSCGCVRDAHRLFDGMSLKDVALWNAMIAGYAKVGNIDEASSLLDRMPVRQRNVISWTCVVSGYAQTNQPNEAIEVFRRMQQLDDVKLDEVIMLTVLSACADLGALELGERIHKYADNHGLNTTVSFKNALINMYAKSGKIEKALEIFESMNDRFRSVVTWTTIIAGLALHGRGREAVQIFTRMEKLQVKPNDVTFIAILTACTHIGSVKMGQSYFNAMKSTYGIDPRIEHYGCLINLYGRAGFLEEARELARRMPFEANAAIWGSLLAAANVHNDVELGECALKQLMKIEPENSGNYALLSNVYSCHRRWNESMMIRKMMRDTGVKKMPGWSFIEVSNKVHKFLSGETSHPGLSRIHEVLSKMDGHLKNIEHQQRKYSELLDFDIV